MKENSIHPKNTSFQPAPGRYEIADNIGCACSAKLIYWPGFELEIERQKLLKFRRQKYKKMEANQYYTPQWRHVKGHGLSYLFKDKRISNKTSATSKSLEREKKDYRSPKFFHDARYVFMITDPKRNPISLRESRKKPPPVEIVYNCMSKRIMRRHLKSNKKIAFMSGKERWSSRVDMLRLSSSESPKTTKRELLTEKKVKNLPVMRTPKSKIESRLHELPKRFRGTAQDSRKKLFKFLPPPAPKILVSDSEFKIGSSHELLHEKALDPKNFFKSEFL